MLLRQPASRFKGGKLVPIRSVVMSDNTDIPTLRRLLTENHTIAMVGLSANWYRPSYFAAKYLQ
jgi:hypothetical protein